MSEIAASDQRSLSDLVTAVDLKITVRKDATKPYVGLENIPSRGAQLLGWAPANSSISTNSVFLAGDILFGKLRPNLRKCVIATFGGYCSTDILVLRPNAGIDPRFAGKVLSAERVGAAAEMTAVGTKMPRTSWKHLAQLRVFCPNLAEQAKIAQILDTLDTAIQDSEMIVDKLKGIKQGLLHELLTRGIAANGELRPPQAEAPHLYKQSPLGWIPMGWELRGVLDVAPTNRQCILTGPFGAELGQADFKAEGVPVLRIGNVQAGYIDWTDTQFVTLEKANSLGKYRVLEGDLLFARQGATTGRNALADGRADGAVINYHIIRVAVDHGRCHPTYLYALFNSDRSKSQVDQVKGRGTREGINSEQIASLLFPLPRIDEQREAVARIAAMDATTASESLMLEKLQLTRVGLIDDLLTGRIRVTPLLAQSQQ